MNLSLNKPHYRSKPLRSTAALSRALGVDLDVLQAQAKIASKQYRPVKPKPGSTREVFDAFGLLKDIHRRIKDQILANVDFPNYLQGSLKGRDYVTNAKLHTNKKILFSEDIEKFFPSVKSEKVHDVWNVFFGFSVDVATLLTQLTTKDGALPQGAVTSSYIANLALWRDEPVLQAKLEQAGITYSRYVDDICLSSKNELDTLTQTELIRQLYGMLSRNNLRASRRKHKVFTASRKMVVTKLTVNTKPSLTKTKRSEIRAQVFQLEKLIQSHYDVDTILEASKKAAQRVGQLGRFHPAEATKLKVRIQIVRAQLLNK
jgi:hypothetical protein